MHNSSYSRLPQVCLHLTQSYTSGGRYRNCHRSACTSRSHTQAVDATETATGLPAPHTVIHKRWTLQKLPQVCLHLTRSYTSGGRYRNCHSANASIAWFVTLTVHHISWKTCYWPSWSHSDRWLFRARWSCHNSDDARRSLWSPTTTDTACCDCYSDLCSSTTCYAAAMTTRVVASFTIKYHTSSCIVWTVVNAVLSLPLTFSWCDSLPWFVIRMILTVSKEISAIKI